MENALIINREDFDQVCRCCLKKGPLTSLLEVVYEDASFVEIFFNLFGEQIDFNDELPKCACEKCIGDIILCYGFKQTYDISLTILATVIENGASGDSGATAEEKNIEEILSIEEPKIVDPDDFTRNENTDEEKNVKIIDEKTDTSLDEEIKEETHIISDLENEEITETVHKKSIIAKTYSCELCSNKKFKTRITLWRHRRTMHQTKNTCKICNKSFMHRDTLQVHKRIHALLKAAENENSDTEKEVVSKSTPESKTYSCEICSKTFMLRHLLIKHRREEKHTAPTKIACEICNKIISHRGKSHHMRICHSGEKPFVCEYCGMAFNIKKNLSRHIMGHTGERPYVCDICGKGFIRKNSLIEHGRSHTGEKPFLCDHCGKTFTLKTHYRLHLIKKHTDKQSSGEISIKKVQPVQCIICNKIFSTKVALRNHMTVHTGQKDFLCTHCGKNFSTRGALRSHSITHSGDKKFTCNVCGMNYRRYMDFKSHQYIHSEKKTFTCKICSKAFRKRVYLKTHLRSHTGEKPYACPYCDKSFAYRSTRTVHVRSHTGEKPYICDVCSKGFYHSSAMTQHRHIHFKNGAGIKLSKCEENE